MKTQFPFHMRAALEMGEKVCFPPGVGGEDSLEDGSVVGDAQDKRKTGDRLDIIKALEVVERDSAAIAESYASLFCTLRLALSELCDDAYLFSRF
ncbi:hypothetical protein HPP92_001496 [Vanilla planifolia]|uniref:Uncharacterized protein n=1 Tax=Vanilla planifolia TaxID=51239 RepID=A0A835RQS0_VANPL|nr:hypothetical protein HPP92_001496 [Vanilla planifolia]